MDLHSIKEVGWTKVKPTFCLVRCASALEDQLQGVLNLAVTQVAGERRVAESRSTHQLSSRHDPVHDLPASGCVFQVHVAISAGAAVAEHRMVEQVEELQAELQFRTLAQDFRHAPVLVERKVHIPEGRAMALSSLGLRRLAENITVHGEGCGVDPLQLVSAEAGRTSVQWTNAKIREGAVAEHPPRIRANAGPGGAGYSTGERDAAGALQCAPDGEGIAGCKAHHRAGLPSTGSAFQKAIPP